jgi:hypothetical protein
MVPRVARCHAVEAAVHMAIGDSRLELHKHAGSCGSMSRWSKTRCRRKKCRFCRRPTSQVIKLSFEPGAGYLEDSQTLIALQGSCVTFWPAVASRKGNSGEGFGPRLPGTSRSLDETTTRTQLTAETRPACESTAVASSQIPLEFFFPLQVHQPQPPSRPFPRRFVIAASPVVLEIWQPSG